jgi:hypothetical protein
VISHSKDTLDKADSDSDADADSDADSDADADSNDSLKEGSSEDMDDDQWVNSLEDIDSLPKATRAHLLRRLRMTRAYAVSVYDQLQQQLAYKVEEAYLLQDKWEAYEKWISRLQ